MIGLDLGGFRLEQNRNFRGCYPEGSKASTTDSGTTAYNVDFKCHTAGQNKSLLTEKFEEPSPILPCHCSVMGANITNWADSTKSTRLHQNTTDEEQDPDPTLYCSIAIRANLPCLGPYACKPCARETAGRHSD
ncbi:uncharacterized protein PADG_11985 [Paracoccidioides brasiliensis Pb18]|uniref:Uncharacterized protein n=1 Tax=Paracoccidioides brasiliensis (strain Pb18) TaxID=502780 RepID=A0A0A0HU58_PARBD|nr:uncharacterized protein PADG_11985 [Paracoccidioides brasiliensis Pb18]KGM91848.1 hypothetical protein PADG_11985 [Paracoccidioides brasiliensis Pb18]ODH51647.1 hypothetical protein GX48_02112 [Paracoccidioides brasiliensis]